jgi:hypothetical protein
MPVIQVLRLLIQLVHLKHDTPILAILTPTKSSFTVGCCLNRGLKNSVSIKTKPPLNSKINYIKIIKVLLFQNKFRVLVLPI